MESNDLCPSQNHFYSTNNNDNNLIHLKSLTETKDLNKLKKIKLNIIKSSFFNFFK